MLKTATASLGDNELTVYELDVATMIDLVGRARDLQDPTDLDLANAYEYLPEFIMDAILRQPLRPLITPGVSHDELEQLYQKAQELNPFLARAIKTMAESIKASALLLSESSAALSDLLSGGMSASGDMDFPPTSTPSTT